MKALAEKLNTKEYQQAVKEGRWYTYQLSSVASLYDWSRRADPQRNYCMSGVFMKRNLMLRWLGLILRILRKWLLRLKNSSHNQSMKTQGTAPTSP